METALGPLCRVVLGIRSPWASAWVTDDLHHNKGDTRLHRKLLGIAIEPGRRERLSTTDLGFGAGCIGGPA